MVAEASLDRSVTPPRVIYSDALAFFDSVGWIGDTTGPRQKLDLPTDAVWDVQGDTLLVKPRTPYTAGGRTFAPDALLACRLSAFLDGDRHFDILCEPGPRRSLETFFWAGDRLVLSILDDLVPRFEILERAGDGFWCGGEKGTLRLVKRA